MYILPACSRASCFASLYDLYVSSVRSINMSMLFNGDNSDSDGELKINAEYAKIYDNFRQKEELHKRERT